MHHIGDPIRFVPCASWTVILRLNHLQTTYIPTPSAHRRIADHLLLVASLLLTQTQLSPARLLSFPAISVTAKIVYPLVNIEGRLASQ
jgi:hypothetical protein